MYSYLLDTTLGRMRVAEWQRHLGESPAITRGCLALCCKGQRHQRFLLHFVRFG
jgi:hypothetical protein